MWKHCYEKEHEKQDKNNKIAKMVHSQRIPVIEPQINIKKERNKQKIKIQ